MSSFCDECDLDQATELCEECDQKVCGDCLSDYHSGHPHRPLTPPPVASEKEDSPRELGSADGPSGPDAGDEDIDDQFDSTAALNVDFNDDDDDDDDSEPPPAIPNFLAVAPPAVPPSDDEDDFSNSSGSSSAEGPDSYNQHSSSQFADRGAAAQSSLVVPARANVPQRGGAGQTPSATPSAPPIPDDSVSSNEFDGGGDDYGDHDHDQYHDYDDDAGGSNSADGPLAPLPAHGAASSPKKKIRGGVSKGARRRSASLTSTPLSDDHDDNDDDLAKCEQCHRRPVAAVVQLKNGRSLQLCKPCTVERTTARAHRKSNAASTAATAAAVAAEVANEEPKSDPAAGALGAGERDSAPTDGAAAPSKGGDQPTDGSNTASTTGKRKPQCERCSERPAVARVVLGNGKKVKLCQPCVDRVTSAAPNKVPSKQPPPVDSGPTGQTSGSRRRSSESPVPDSVLSPRTRREAQSALRPQRGSGRSVEGSPRLAARSSRDPKPPGSPAALRLVSPRAAGSPGASTEDQTSSPVGSRVSKLCDQCQLKPAAVKVKLPGDRGISRMCAHCLEKARTEGEASNRRRGSSEDEDGSAAEHLVRKVHSQSDVHAAREPGAGSRADAPHKGGATEPTGSPAAPPSNEKGVLFVAVPALDYSQKKVTVGGRTLLSKVIEN